MLREIIATGRTVDAAIDAGCEQLGLPRDEIDFEIIDMPHKGFLGLSQSPAKVRVFKEEPDPPAEQDNAVNLDEKVAMAQQYVLEIISDMGLEQDSVDVVREENGVNLKINGDVAGVAIGRRGETLDALQYLTSLAVNRIAGDYLRVVIDSGNYREKRRNTLEQLAKKLAAAVIKTGRNTTLEPMNPYERRIIHSTISEIEGVSSTSVGEEPNRCVVISSTNPRPQQNNRYDNRPRSNGGHPARQGMPSNHRDGKGRSDNNRNSNNRGPRREKPAPYKESTKREVAPAEAANQPLYGKIEL